MPERLANVRGDHCWHPNPKPAHLIASGPIEGQEHVHCCSCPATGVQDYKIVTTYGAPAESDLAWPLVHKVGGALRSQSGPLECPGYKLRVEKIATVGLMAMGYLWLGGVLLMARMTDDMIPWAALFQGLREHWAVICILIMLYMSVSVILYEHQQLARIRRQLNLMRATGAPAVAVPKKAAYAMHPALMKKRTYCGQVVDAAGGPIRVRKAVVCADPHCELAGRPVGSVCPRALDYPGAS
jgi:hypothetical protein